MYEYVITFLIGFIASILGGMAGGGAGLVTSPMFILMGLPPHVAIATAKFGGLGITLGGFLTFRKTAFIKWEYVTYLSCIAFITSLIGSFWLLSLDEKLVEKIIGVVLLSSLPVLIFKKNSGVINTVTSFATKIVGYIFYSIINIVTSAFGGGIGTMVPVILTNFFGLTSLEANATRKIPGLIGALVSLSVFMASSVVDYKLGGCILIGTYLGSTIGTKVAIKQGDLFVKRLLIVVVLILAVKLLLF